MALIRLRGCAGWSAPVLLANLRRQNFSRRGPYVKYHTNIIRELSGRVLDSRLIGYRFEPQWLTALCP